MTGTWMRSPRGGCVQLYPGSTVQVALHPSPGMVLPSSQSSPSSTPSPQVLAQADPGGHLGST